MIHGHEVLHMMEGNNYSNRESLVEAIINKFVPSNNDDFTVDTSKICNH